MDQAFVKRACWKEKNGGLGCLIYTISLGNMVWKINIQYCEDCLQMIFFGSPGMPIQKCYHKEGHLTTFPKLELIIVSYTQSPSDELKYTFIW